MSKMNYFTNICRICMSREIELVNIYRCDDDMLTFIDKLNTCIPEIFNENNYIPLPDNICILCCKNLKISFWFRELCLKSNTIFRTYKLNLEKEPNGVQCAIKSETSAMVKEERQDIGVPVQIDLEDRIKSEELLEIDQTTAVEQLVDHCKTEMMDSNQELCNTHLNDFLNSNSSDTEIMKTSLPNPTESTPEIDDPPLIEPEVQTTELPVFSHLIKADQDEDDPSLSDPPPELEMNIVEQVNLAIQASAEFQRKITEANHNPDLKMRHLCSYCGKPFKFRQDMRIHERMHTGFKPYICTICNKSFAKSTRLKVHINTHTREKAYTCTFCNKIFNQNSNLIMHMKLHTQTERFACTQCEKTFSQKRHLKQHLLFHEDERRYTCDICNWNFTMKHHLKRHMLTHNGETNHRKSLPKDRERKFPCTKCEWSFMSKEVLKRHMLVHAKDNPKLRKSLNDEKRRFPCPLCVWSFTKKHHLERHMIKHEDNRKFGCHLCEEEFQKNYELQRHLKAHIQNSVGCHLEFDQTEGSD